MRKALEASTAPIVAVAPIIGGKAIKGPTAKMMSELGFEVGAETVAKRYGELWTATSSITLTPLLLQNSPFRQSRPML